MFEKMILLYLTKVNLEGRAAQVIQIKKMCAAFEKTFHGIFVLAAPGSLKSRIENFKDIKGTGSRSFLNLTVFLIEVVTFNYFWRSDLIYTRDLIVCILCVFVKKKVVLEIHHNGKGRLYPFLVSKVAHNRHVKIVSISAGLKHYLISELGVPSKKVFVAHDACDGDRAAENNSFYKDIVGPTYKWIAVHAGSFNESRGSSDIVGLALRCPSVAFVQIGGYPPRDGRLGASNIYPGNVFFMEHLDQKRLKVALASADVLLFPMSRRSPIYWCTSPMKLYDYMEAGKPVLGSCVGSSREILERFSSNDLEVPWFVEYNEGDIQDAIKCLNQLLTNYQHHKNAALRNSRIVTQNATWENRAKDIISFINEGAPHASG